MLLARGLGRMAAHIPRAVSYRLADLTADLLYHLLPTYRRNVSANLSVVLGCAPEAIEVQQMARRVFRTSARNFVDLLRLPHISIEQIWRTINVAPGSWENLDDALAHGRGAVVVTAHVGAFDFAGQAAVLHGYPVIALTTRTVPEFIYTSVTHLRAAAGMRILEATPGGVRRVLQAVRRGDVAVLLADRDFFRTGEPIDFFGRPTTLPVGPARLARDTGAPLVPLFTRRRGKQFDFWVDKPFHVERTAEPELDIRRGMERMVATFERVIRDAPEQWVMFQEVWPERPIAPLRVFPIGSPLAGKIMGRGTDLSRPLTDPDAQADEPEAAEPTPEPVRRRRPNDS